MHTQVLTSHNLLWSGNLPLSGPVSQHSITWWRNMINCIPSEIDRCPWGAFIRSLEYNLHQLVIWGNMTRRYYVIPYFTNMSWYSSWVTYKEASFNKIRVADKFNIKGTSARWPSEFRCQSGSNESYLILYSTIISNAMNLEKKSINNEHKQFWDSNEQYWYLWNTEVRF